MSMFRTRLGLLSILVLTLAILLVPAAPAYADGPYTGVEADNYLLPLPPLRARVEPPPIPVPFIKSASNEREPGEESAAENSRSTKNNDITLASSGDACLDFEGLGDWGSNFKPWDDQFGGWVPFAVDDGGLYEIENVVFSREESIRAGAYSFKFSSNQPYAAGIHSPTIEASAGDEIEVSVSYYIHQHGRTPKDWASMGVMQTDDPCEDGCYVNGYTRGSWATLSHTITPTTDSGIMILLQAESPEKLNSAIYFDELVIKVNGEVRSTSCKLE